MQRPRLAFRRRSGAGGSRAEPAYRWTKTNGAATAPDETPFRPEDDTRTLAVSEPGGGGGEFLTWSLIGGELPRHTSEEPDVAEDRIP